MMKWIDKIIGRLCPDRQPAGPVLEIDASIIRCRFPNGLIQQLMWDKLKAVIIETNDKGPFEEDVYFLLLSDSKEDFCAIPQCAENTQSLLSRLQVLPNFDNEAVIQAMGCASNKSFLCWEQEGWMGENWPGVIEARNFRKR